MCSGGYSSTILFCRYTRSEVIDGDPYAGFDRHNAEIAGFHLDGWVLYYFYSLVPGGLKVIMCNNYSRA